jgi:hypothetical protein
MSENPTHSPRFPFLRRVWKPALVTGAGGTATAVWFEEIMIYGQEILALIFLPIMAAMVYLLDIFIFKSQQPRVEKSENTHDKKRS